MHIPFLGLGMRLPSSPFFANEAPVRAAFATDMPVDSQYRPVTSFARCSRTTRPAIALALALLGESLGKKPGNPD